MQNEDFKWFIENYNSLVDVSKGTFIAIKNKTVLGYYDDFFTALDCTEKTEELGTFLIQKCTGNESDYMKSIFSVNITY